MSRPAHNLTLLLVIAGLLSCGTAATDSQPSMTEGRAPIPSPSLSDTAPVDMDGVHNVVAYGPELYSGSAPEGDNAFKTLASLGVKTIVSVDGAVPDVDGAAEEGMRYVHLPINYSGMTDARSREIARAVRDLPGPVYVHCHHGKHRSAAAAGVAAVELGILDPNAAVARMKVSGTAPGYKGLYACVENATRQPDAALDRADNSFPSSFRPTGITESMVDIDEIHEHLKEIEKTSWRTPVDHPDLVPVQEAARLADILRNLKEDSSLSDKPAEFHDMLSDAAQAAHDLEDLLAANGSLEALNAQFKVVSNDCKSCHTKYRD